MFFRYTLSIQRNLYTSWDQNRLLHYTGGEEILLKIILEFLPEILCGTQWDLLCPTANAMLLSQRMIRQADWLIWPYRLDHRFSLTNSCQPLGAPHKGGPLTSKRDIWQKGRFGLIVPVVVKKRQDGHLTILKSLESFCCSLPGGGFSPN